MPPTAPDSAAEEERLTSHILTAARTTWPHMRTTVAIELHSALDTGAHVAFLVDRGGGAAALPEPRPWYRTVAHPTRAAALAELRRFVDRMRPIRAWADDVRAQTAGQVPKRLPLRPSVQEMREGERWRRLMGQMGEERGGSGAERR